MESRHAKWKVEVQECCTYHLQNPDEVLSPQCRLMLQNAENSANTTQTPLFVLCFLALMVSPVCFQLYGLLDFMASIVFTCSPQPKPQA